MHGQLEAVAMRDDAAARLFERELYRREARLRRVVGVVETGLPARQVALVDRVEEKEATDVRLAERKLHRLPVIRGLRRFGHRLRRCGLLARVEALLRREDLRLDAELVVPDRQRVVTERVAEQGDQLVV